MASPTLDQILMPPVVTDPKCVCGFLKSQHYPHSLICPVYSKSGLTQFREKHDE
jgi:hypothetical protein